MKNIKKKLEFFFSFYGQHINQLDLLHTYQLQQETAFCLKTTGIEAILMKV